MNIIGMFLFMLSPLLIPVIGELVGRLNDTFTFFGRRGEAQASYQRAATPRRSETA
jgi:hypothetical protein